MDKKEYRFSIKDKDVNEFFEKQSNKSLSFRVIVYDAIDKYGKEDVINAILKSRHEEAETNE